MPKSLIKEKETAREKAKKNFEELSLADKVQTNKEYSQICSPLPIKGKVVDKEIIPGLEEDLDTIPYIVIVEIKPGRTVEVNALWLEKVN